MMKKLILASGSPRRKQLLEKYGYDFIVDSGECDEVFDDSLDVYRAIMDVAYQKGIEIVKKYTDCLVVSADTIIYFDNDIIGKPLNYDDAFNILKRLSGNTHEVITGVCINDGSVVDSFYDISYVTFKKLSDSDIKRYLSYNESMDKAGAYAIQLHGKELVKKIEGDFENIIGLPMMLLNEKLKEIL